MHPELGKQISEPDSLLQKWIRVWCDNGNGECTQLPRRAESHQDCPQVSNSTLLCRCINVLTEYFPTSRETLTVQYNTKTHYLHQDRYSILVYQLNSVVEGAKQYMVTRVKLQYTHCINPGSRFWLTTPDLFHTIFYQLRLFYAISRNYDLQLYQDHTRTCVCTHCTNLRRIFKLTLTGVTYGLVYCPERYSRHCTPLVKKCTKRSCPCHKTDFRKLRRYASKLRSAKKILQELYHGIPFWGFGDAEAVPLR